jgi:hypothetical protein
MICTILNTILNISVEILGEGSKRHSLESLMLRDVDGKLLTNKSFRLVLLSFAFVSVANKKTNKMCCWTVTKSEKFH